MGLSEVQVIHADAFDFDASFFAQFDVYIGDPPYSAHVHDSAVSHSATVRDGRVIPLGTKPRDLGFDCLSPELRQHIALAVASVKRWGVVFSDFEGTAAWRDAVRAEYIREVPTALDGGADFELPWVRWSQPQKSGDRPPTGAEAVLHFHACKHTRAGAVKPIAKHWNGPGNLLAYTRRSLRGEHKHKAEKPIDLMLDLVSWYSDPGESILDLTAGYATTGLAALLLGRDCVCVELNEEWARIGASRCEAPLMLGGRDKLRVEEWIEATATEADTTIRAAFTDGSVARAMRRLEDAARVAAAIGA